MYIPEALFCGRLVYTNIHISYSYVGVTIGSRYKYSSEPYDRAKELRKVR